MKAWMSKGPSHGVAYYFGGQSLRYTSFNGYSGPDSIELSFRDSTGTVQVSNLSFAVRDHSQSSFGLLTGAIAPTPAPLGTSIPIEHALSESGRYLAFLSDASSPVEGFNLRWPVRVDLNTSEAISAPVSSFSQKMLAIDQVSISGDGSHIVFCARTDIDGQFGPVRIYHWNVLSGAVELITPDDNIWAEYSSPVISGDGRYIIFEAYRASLLPGLTDASKQILRYDREEFSYLLVTASPDGEPANGPCWSPSVSRDGSRIAFLSSVSNLGPAISGGTVNVYFKDLRSGSTEIVSKDGAGNMLIGEARQVVLSSDGSHLAFRCAYPAFILDSDPTRSSTAFRVDLANHEITELRLPSPIVIWNSGRLALTRDGGTVYMLAGIVGSINPYPGVLLRFRREETYGEVVVSSGNGTEGQQRIVASDGHVSVDGNGDMVVHSIIDRGQHLRVVHDMDRIGEIESDNSIFPYWTTEAIGHHYPVRWSDDGRMTVFESTAANMAPDDEFAHSDIFVSYDNTPRCQVLPFYGTYHLTKRKEIHGPAVNHDGSAIAFLFGSGTGSQIHLREQVGSSDTLLLNSSVSGENANGDCSAPLLSADANRCVFSTTALNLVMTEPVAFSPVIWERGVPGVRPLLLRPDGSAASGNILAFSRNGRKAICMSQDLALVPDAATIGDIGMFVVDLDTGQASRVDEFPQGNGIGTASLSADGRYCAFSCVTDSFLGSDTNGCWDIFRIDTTTLEVVLVSRTQDGFQGDGHSTDPSISADGNYIAFCSAAGNFITDGKPRGSSNIFVKNMTTGELRCANTDDAGVRPRWGTDGQSPTYGDPIISPDGSTVVFITNAIDLLPECRCSTNLIWKRLIPVAID